MLAVTAKGLFPISVFNGEFRDTDTTRRKVPPEPYRGGLSAAGRSTQREARPTSARRNRSDSAARRDTRSSSPSRSESQRRRRDDDRSPSSQGKIGASASSSSLRGGSGAGSKSSRRRGGSNKARSASPEAIEAQLIDRQKELIREIEADIWSLKCNGWGGRQQGVAQGGGISESDAARLHLLMSTPGFTAGSAPSTTAPSISVATPRTPTRTPRSQAAATTLAGSGAFASGSIRVPAPTTYGTSSPSALSGSATVPPAATTATVLTASLPRALNSSSSASAFPGSASVPVGSTGAYFLHSSSSASALPGSARLPVSASSTALASSVVSPGRTVAVGSLTAPAGSSKAGSINAPSVGSLQAPPGSIYGSPVVRQAPSLLPSSPFMTSRGPQTSSASSLVTRSAPITQMAGLPLVSVASPPPLLRGIRSAPPPSVTVPTTTPTTRNYINGLEASRATGLQKPVLSGSQTISSYG